ncbi:hypothetical protein OG393_30770 [Streptomyces sp. NBC_01216]|uniref:hypothetical protein n=1 Tax=Streptomyces sp. NBC_01216 TaxID=2903778 RepID=UPI002E0F819C|nr:hypothetical protein OG393_30770 [Streptomyces sp. NBC_01216]
MTVYARRAAQAPPDLHALITARVTALAGTGIGELRLTPYQRGTTRFWCVMALGVDRREVPLPQGAPRRLSDALREAFPAARWDRAQDYDVRSGILTEHVIVLPEILKGSVL